jgi:hypothetical protein
LCRIFFAGSKPISIELKKKDADDKPSAFVTVYKRMVAYNLGSVGGRHANDIYVTGISEILTRPRQSRFLYAPWKILEWAKLWPGRYGNEFSMAGSVATMTASLGLILLLALKRHLSGPAISYLHGSARWAEKKTSLPRGCCRTRSLVDVLRGRMMPHRVRLGST